MSDNIGKTNFDYLRDCGCGDTDAPQDTVPCSDQASDVNFNNVGTNYVSTDVRSALIEVDNKRVQNGADIQNRVATSGDSMTGDLVFENPANTEVGRITPDVNFLGINAVNLIGMDTPNVAVSGWSGLVGYTLTVGQDGLIVPVLKTVAETTWNDTSNTAVPLANQSYTDLGVSVTTDDVIDSWQYKAVITGTSSAPLNLTFQLKADGTPIATTQQVAVVSGTAGVSVEFSDVSNYASGTQFTLEAQIDEASGTYSVDFIDFTISKLSVGGTSWGQITGTLSNQVDLNSRFLTNESAISSLQAPVFTGYTPQASKPVGAVEGSVYFNSDKQALTVITDVPNFEHNLGQELTIPVVNRTGVTIPNGKPVAHDGVDITTGKVRIRLAQADTFINARVLGMTTHEMVANAEGVITKSGSINDIDTSSLSIGVPIYLSATEAGGFTETPPDILTQLGGVLVQDALVGSFQVEIENAINLPVAVGALGRGTTDVFPLNGTPTNIDNFEEGDGVINTVIPASGVITIANAGWHEFTFSMSGSVNDEEEDIYFELYDATNNDVIGSRRENTGRSSTPADVAFSPDFTTLIDVPASNTDIIIRAYTDGTSLNMTVDSMQFYSKSIHIR